MEATAWQKFWNGPFFLGKNVFGGDIYRRYYGGVPPDGVIGAAGSTEGAYTVFKNISKRIRAKSTINFFVGMKLANFESSLAKAAGKAWQYSEDGKVKKLFHKGIEYISRNFSKSGESTIEIWKDGNLLQKYRLSN